MHLLNAARQKFQCIPVIHEVSAVIMAEYFNESLGNSKAFVLVTAGPGLTNTITAVAGAWMESRNVLIVGGQVKSTDLQTGGVRQRGIQEIDGVRLLQSITKTAIQLRSPISNSELQSYIDSGISGRPGPVFIEICLDTQAAKMIVDEFRVADKLVKLSLRTHLVELDSNIFYEVKEALINSSRPILLLGGGVSREVSRKYLAQFAKLGIPLMTTWNAADRLDYNFDLYFGRPNTWGQRSANVILQQADLLIAVGTRLGYQQTGFNWQGFLPIGKIIHVDIDKSELDKGHPETDFSLEMTSEEFLGWLSSLNFDGLNKFTDWIDFANDVKKKLPNNETSNVTRDDFINPYSFIETLSELATADDLIVPASSGGAFTTTLQAFRQKLGQIIISNKGMASMGYGLAGALGASYAFPERRTILIEGDGGFAQNIQELGTLQQSNHPVKVFIFDNGGYASIRMTQLNYFDGNYIGCDSKTGLGLPDWSFIAKAYGLDFMILKNGFEKNPEFLEIYQSNQPAFFIVPIQENQTYFPKLNSRILDNGLMETNPLHLMSPDLDERISGQVFKYLEVEN
jgi:acetolactate synthase-1/2/3 large subunit